MDLLDELQGHAVPAGFRMKPHNIEAEQALLGAILVNNEAWHRVAEFLRPEHFYEPVHGRIYEAMSRQIGAGQLADYVTLKTIFDEDEALRGLDGARYLARLSRAAETILNAGDYGRVLHDLGLKRGLIALGEDMTNRAYDPTVPDSGSEQISTALQQLERLAAEQPAESWQHIGALLVDMAERIVAPAEIYPTGLPTLDRSLNGGIIPGCVYGIEARPKVGKTLLAGTIALSMMRQDCPMLFLALEMGTDRIVERMVASETRCNAVRFRKREDPEDLVNKLRVFGDRYNSRRAYYSNERGMSFERLQRVATNAVLKLGIKALFIDYMQLVTNSSGREMSTAEHLTRTAQWLEAFAGQNKCAVIVTSQENRSGESFGSDGLAKACDWLGRLHKVEQQDRSVGDIEAMWIEVKFSRDGAAGDIGSDQLPAFRIDKIGPVVREHGDW